MEFGYCSDPSAFGEFSRFPAHEFDVRQAHVPGVVEHFAILDHDEEDVAVMEVDFVGHISLGSFGTLRLHPACTEIKAREQRVIFARCL